MLLKYLKIIPNLILVLKSPLGTNGTIRNPIRVSGLKMLIEVKLKSNFNSISNFGPKIHNNSTSDFDNLPISIFTFQS